MTRRGLCMVAVLLAVALARHAGAGELKTAIFAGGCFWCVEADFDKVPGVVKTVSGYTGGRVANPTYEQVSSGGTGHREAVEVTFDPATISYGQLLDVFWHAVDPTDAGGQFCDRGEQYTTAVFVLGDEQRRIAEESKLEAQARLGKTIVTPILPAGAFYPAEDYHQDYHNKETLKYQYYRWGCGRNQRVKSIWGKDAYEGIPHQE